MIIARPYYIEIDGTGDTISLDLANTATDYYFVNSASPLTLTGSYTVNFDASGWDASAIPDGRTFRVSVGSIILDGNTFTINGTSLTDLQALAGRSIEYGYFDGAWRELITLNDGTGNISGAVLADASVDLDKLTGVTSTQIIVGNGATPSVPTAVTVTGDVTISNTGVTSIAAGVIVDADINASAAITRSKVAAGTASQVVINAAGTGLLSSEAQLANSRGGTGQDTSASNGFPNVAAGTWSVGALTDITRRENVSFVTAQQGTYYIYFPFPCTVTQANVRVTSVVSGTDDGELLFENDASAAMTGDNLTAGVLTVASGAAFGTGYTTSLDTNNTFTAGQEMRITSSKVTTGGIVSVDITYTRLTLS